MTPQAIMTLGVAVWGLVFLALLAALAVESDVERRWDEAWAIDWEARTGRQIDELIDSLAGQVRAWRLARRLLSLYLAASCIALVVLAVWQARSSALAPDVFRGVMIFGGAITGFLFLPLRVATEIGLGLVEGMHRQARVASGERLVIRSKRELDAYPRPVKPGKSKPTDEQAAAPAAK